MAVRIKDKNNIPKALKNIEMINKRKVSVGYFGDDYDGGKITVKGLARVHEFGCDIAVTPKMRGFFAWKFGINLKASTTHIRIPERSFLRSGADEGFIDVYAQCKRIIAKAIIGDIPVNKFYEQLGDVLADAIKVYAYDLQSPENAPLTIHNKGFDDPLVETGTMINSIEVLVR